MAGKLFKERWQRQWQQFSKYLRYVFNDHAILALVFLMGAGLVSYQKFLSSMEVTLLNQFVITGLTLLTGMILSRPATFIKEEDAIYFLGNEGDLRQLRYLGLMYSLAIRTVIQLIILLVLFPVVWLQLNMHIGWLISVVIGSVALALANMTWLYVRAGRFEQQYTESDLLNWRRIASLETKRVQKIVHVFSWFVDIPEQKATVKPHRWSDWMIRHWPNGRGLTALYITSFFRTNDYLQLWGTMTVLGGVLLVTLQGWLLIGTLMGLMYVFLIQILPIMLAYQQRVFDHLIPVTMQQRQRAFHQVAGQLMGMMLFLWLMMGLIAGLTIKSVLMIEFGLVLWAIALVFLYSDRKAENMFKRR